MKKLTLKKFIEQLSGKIGQSLRKFTETQGQPDFELEKFIHYYRQLILLRWMITKKRYYSKYRWE
jgi:hypothetical protein